MFGKLFKSSCAELPAWQAELQVAPQVVTWRNLWVFLWDLDPEKKSCTQRLVVLNA